MTAGDLFDHTGSPDLGGAEGPLVERLVWQWADGGWCMEVEEWARPQGR